MEILKKIINIESALSRYPNERIYNKIPFDININETDEIFELANNLPIIEGRLRYRTMIDHYNKLKNALLHCVPYYYCNEKWVKINILNKSIENNDNFIKEFPDNPISGKTYLLTDDYDYLYNTFYINDMFKTRVFLSFIEGNEEISGILETIGVESDDTQTSFHQYINIPICLVGNIVDLGELEHLDIENIIPYTFKSSGLTFTIGESQLSLFRRNKIIVDDDGETHESLIIYNPSTNRYESVLRYNFIPITNNLTNLTNKIESISIKFGDEEPPLITFDNNIVIDSGEYRVSGTCVFNYIIGYGETVSGVSYQEEYTFVRKEEEFIYNDNPKAIYYYYEMTPISDFNGEYEVDRILTEYALVKDDSKGKASEIYTNIDLKIDRGSNSAFEQHNILSEVNTLQDLENYRNGYFKMENT